MRGKEKMLKELYGTSTLKYENKEETLEYYILNNNDEIDTNKYNVTRYQTPDIDNALNSVELHCLELLVFPPPSSILPEDIKY